MRKSRKYISFILEAPKWKVKWNRGWLKSSCIENLGSSSERTGLALSERDDFVKNERASTGGTKEVTRLTTIACGW